MSEKAIIIGAGSSIDKFDHLKLLSKSNFNGHLFIADVMMKKCLENGITPDKFPNYHVVSVEFGTYIRNFYTSDLRAETTQKYAKQIHCILYTYETDFTDLLRKLGFQVEVIPETEYSKTFANVGITGWFIAYEKYKCDEAALIGFNMGWDEEYTKQFPLDYDVFWKRGNNPELNYDYVLDPLYDYFRQTFLEWIIKTPIKTVNCTQEGSLHGEGIQQMEFLEWLQKRN